MSPHRNECGESLNGDCFIANDSPEPTYTRSTATTSNGTTSIESSPVQSAGDVIKAKGLESSYTKPSAKENGVDGINGHAANRSPFLIPTEAEDTHDLICIGFGPASLAVAVAIHDALSSGHELLFENRPPKVLFLEKQSHFAWHGGMLLPGAKMQISFLKDLATLRNPRSEFTFLNYLHKGGRLVDFTNLSTFLPSRVEYEDYLRWCATFFEDVVRYNHQVSGVSPHGLRGVETFSVTCQDITSGQTKTYQARNVLFGIGGQPKLPKALSLDHARIIHSSQYAHLVPRILNKRDAPYKVAVVGAGQSAAEIFSNIQTLYPNSRTHLIMRSEFLRPSDDSPL
jgi:L-ornithine N5-monooxygenase